jgi:hypothetical protein
MHLKSLSVKRCVRTLLVQPDWSHPISFPLFQSAPSCGLPSLQEIAPMLPQLGIGVHHWQEAIEKVEAVQAFDNIYTRERFATSDEDYEDSIRPCVNALLRGRVYPPSQLGFRR